MAEDDDKKKYGHLKTAVEVWEESSSHEEAVHQWKWISVGERLDSGSLSQSKWKHAKRPDTSSILSV